MKSIEQRVAELEKRVAGLEASQTRPADAEAIALAIEDAIRRAICDKPEAALKSDG